MKTLVVSNLYDIPNEHFLLNLIFCEGLDYFHLRKLDYDEDDMRRYLDEIPTYFHKKIIIHSHFNLIEEYGLAGAHFTKKYSYEDYILERKDKAIIDFKRIGFSLHSTNEVIKIGQQYDYIFLSPIFDSISNKGYLSKFKLSNLRSFLLNNPDNPEIFALGGINPLKVKITANLGFDGIAILGYIWTGFETDQDLIAAIARYKEMKSCVFNLSSKDVVSN